MRKSFPVLIVTLVLGYAFLCQSIPHAFADERDKLEFTKWSGDINVPDPVAIGFDNQGVAYVTQTQRRKSQDLDIRNNREWIPSDVGFETVQDKIEFYRRELAIGDDKENAKHVGDMNGDGKHDYRDLMVLSERIHRIEDKDADGTADSIQLYADGFDTEVTGIAAGVMHHDGEVYATIAPDVWKLRDTNSDGIADKRTKLATGFGLHIAYAGHDMHGLTVGPDGKIYWSVGDKGISALSKEGKRFHYPNQGGVMRCNPDGSNFEVFAHGLRNVQELAFDQWGNLFGVDNDADKSGERERFVYIVKGMDAGWRCNYQYRGSSYDPWMAEGLWKPWHSGQPSYIVPPIEHSIDGPAGFSFNPGTALSPSYRDYFFLTGAPNGNQIAFRVSPNRASFKMADVHAIGNGLPLVGINFAPDGGLYAVDWGGGYPLNQKGAVWRIDVPKFRDSAERRQVQKLLGEGFSDLAIPTLVELLGHADQRIRLGAQFQLVRGNALDAFTSTLRQSKDLLTRVHCIWGLGQLARAGDGKAKKTLEVLPLFAEEPELLFQSMRTLRDVSGIDRSNALPLMNHPSPRVRFMAAQMLAEHPGVSRWEVASYARRTKMSDVYCRLALSRFLAANYSESKLVELKQEASEVFQLAAVVALRRLRSPRLAEFLSGTSIVVAAEAAMAIHDDFSVPSALPALANCLPTQPVQTDKAVPLDGPRESFLRRSISANYRLGTADSAGRLLGFALNQQMNQKLRLEAIASLGAWEELSVLDRVTGRARRFRERSLPTSGLFANQYASLLVDTDPRIVASALSHAMRLRIPVKSEVLAKIVRDSGLDAALRIEALNLMRKQGASSLPVVVKQLCEDPVSSVRIAAIKQVSVLSESDRMHAIRSALASPDLNEVRQAAMVQLAEGAKGQTADQMIVEWLSRVQAKDASSAAIELETLEAAGKRRKNSSAIAKQLLSIETERNKQVTDVPAAMFAQCLEGGSPIRGRELFRNHLSAQCSRCHRIGKKGSDVGPSLDGVASRRDARYLLRSMVAPSHDIDAKYRMTVVMLESGTTEQGVLLESNDRTMKLAKATGEEVQLPLADIEEVFEQKQSIMPDMSGVLTKREIRDLVAFLKTL